LLKAFIEISFTPSCLYQPVCPTSEGLKPFKDAAWLVAPAMQPVRKLVDMRRGGSRTESLPCSSYFQMIFKHVVSFDLKETTLSALMPDIRSKVLNPVLRTTGIMPRRVRSEDVGIASADLISAMPDL
jgi:hypothetical protein